jgi:hypothetical protein
MRVAQRAAGRGLPNRGHDSAEYEGCFGSGSAASHEFREAPTPKQGLLTEPSSHLGRTIAVETQQCTLDRTKI